MLEEPERPLTLNIPALLSWCALIVGGVFVLIATAALVGKSPSLDLSFACYAQGLSFITLGFLCDRDRQKLQE